MFRHLRVLLTLGGLHLRVSQFLETVYNLPTSLFKYKPINPEPIPQPPSLSSYHITPALITPGPGTRQPGTAPISQSLVKLFKLASPEPAHPFLPAETTGKALAHSSSLSLCLLPTIVLPSVAPGGVACLLLLGTNYLFNVEHLLICWHSYTSNFLLTHCVL